MNADDFLDAPTADEFLGPAPAGENWSARMPAGRGSAKRPRREQSVLETPAVAPAFAQAPDPDANARALFNAITANPELVKSPMYSAGAAVIDRARSGAPSSVQAASRRAQVDNALAAQQAQRIDDARTSADTAFGGPVGQAIAAPGRRLLSGVASTLAGVTAVPQLFGSDLGRETSDALSLMSKANMPAESGLADDVLAGLGQVGPMAGSGAVLRGALARVLGEAAATEAATGIMGATGGAMSGQQVLDDLQFRGDLTDADKRARALFAAIMSGASGNVADRFLLPGADKAAAGPLAAGGRALVAEGAQEGLDQLTQNFVTDKDLGDGVARAALVGGLVGGGTRVAGELNSAPYQLAQAIDADAKAFADRSAPQVVQKPVTRAQAEPLAAPAPRAAQVEAVPTPPPALGYDPNVQQRVPLVVDTEGVARPMTADEFLSAEDTRQQAADSGLTPDVRRAQQQRSEPEQAPPETPELVKQLMARGWTPPGGTNPANDETTAAHFDTMREAAARKPGPPTASAPVEDAAHRETVDAMARDLEAMYQADVKDSIRERLGLAKPQEAVAPAPRNSAFFGFLKEHGLKAELASDIYGDNAFHANRALPGVFRRSGMNLDDLVVRAVERGFLTQAGVENALDTGGTRKLVEMIQGQIRGQAPVSTDMADDVNRARTQARVSDELEQQARAIGFDTRGLSDEQVAGALRRIERRRIEAAARQEQHDARAEANAERLAIREEPMFKPDDLDALDAAWDGGDNVSLQDAMRALGFSDQEIEHATAHRPEGARQDSAGDGAHVEDDAGRAQGPHPADARDQGGQRQDEGAGDSLTSYTPEDLARRDTERTAAEKQQADQQKKDDERAQADAARDDFRLTGSDRPADQAAAKGQKGLFSRPTPQIDTPAFKKWFGDSKVVDAAGKPLVVYHGTPAKGLTVFDTARFGTNGRAEGAGIYFTTDKSTADGYGQRGETIAAYLAIRNPLRYDAPPFSAAQMRQLLEAVAKTEAADTGADWRDGFLSNYGDTYSRPLGALVREAVRSFSDEASALDQIGGIVGSGVDASTVNTALTEALGYDGYVSTGYSGEGKSGGDIWVAMRPEQIKSATGNRGTFDASNPDIRFSRPAEGAANTSADVRAELRGRFGDVIDRLEKRGLLKIWDTVQDFNAGQSSERIDGVASGYYDGKTAHLFADGIEPGKALGVLLHEVGEHASMQTMLGSRYDDLVRRAQELVEREDPAAAAADARIPEDTAPEHRDSELLAYLIQEASDRAKTPQGMSETLRRWWADTVAAIRAWWSQTGFNRMLERYGAGIDLRPADMAALAARAVQWQAGRGAAAEGGRLARPTPAADNTVASAAQPWTVAEPGTWDNVVRAVQDNKIDLKRVRAAIEEQFGRVPDSTDAYLQEELYHGKVAARVEKLHEDYIEPLLRKIAVAGKDVGVTLDDVNRYLHALHAPERNAAMQAINPNMPNNTALSGMSDQDAAQALRDFQTAGKAQALASIAADVDTLLADTRTALVADGLEDAATVQAWENAYKHYVPLQRDIEGGPAKGQGFSVRGPEAKRAVGSNRQVVNILANVVTQVETAAIRAEKAEVGRSLVQMAQAYPNPDFWKVDQAPTKPRIDPRTGLVQRAVTDPNFQTADNVLMVKDYGGTHFVVFNGDNPRAMAVAKAMKNLDIQQVPRLIEYAGRATRFMASLLTQRNPEFWLTNFARDLQGSAIQMNGTDAEGLQGKVVANLPDAFAGMREVARKTGASTQWGRYAREFQAAGGATGYMQMFENSDVRMKELQREVDRMRQGKADPRRLVRGMLQFVDDYNDVIENGMRLAVFQAARDSGVSTERAASIAKNITVNFNRKGNASTLANSLYMFFNAGVQGTARLAQALATSNKARVAVGAMAGLAFVMDAVNRYMAGDDDETGRNRYDLIPEFEKSRNWIFMVPGKGSYVKIPLPLGFHVFHNAGRLLSDAAFRRDPRNAAEYGWSFAGTLVDAFSPVGGVASVSQLISPSVTDPVVQLAENKNFMGGPVYRSDDLGFGKTDPKPAYTRYFESTPDVWKAASRLLNDVTGGDKEKRGVVNVEPDILRHIWTAVTGGPGRAADRALDTAQGAGRGQDVTAARVPLISRFYGENDDKQRERAYYEDLKRTAKAKEDFDFFVKAGRRDLAMETLKQLGQGDTARGRRVIDEFERAKKDGRAINRRLRDLQRDNVADEAQAEQLTALRKARVRVYSRAVKDTATADE